MSEISQVTSRQNVFALVRVMRSSFIMQAKDRTTNNFFVGTLLFQPIIITILAVGLYRHGGQASLGLYAVIGAGMIGIWNNNLWTSGRIVTDERRSGTLSLVVASPTTMPVVLVGKSLSNALVSMLAMGVALGTGMLVFGMPLGIGNPLAFCGGLVLTLLAMTSLGLVLGPIFMLTRNAGQFVQVINYPIFILSGLMFPLTLLPMWTRPLSNLLAPMWGNQALSKAAGMLAGSVWSNYVWLLVLTIVYLFIAYRLFQRIEFLVREAGSMEEW